MNGYRANLILHKEESLMKIFLAPLALLALSGAALAQIPSGTVIPVTLHGSLSTRKSKPGQVVKARIMQDIPLGEGSKIRAGAHVQGKVISVTPAVNGHGASVSFMFDRLVTSWGAEPVTTSLRVLASGLEITSAQMPMYSDNGSSLYANITRQVGGEIVFRGGGHVMRGKTVVGEPVNDDGVLGYVRTNPDGNCQGTIDGNNQVQALWVFSSDACGVYGYSRVEILHVGRTNSLGEIALSSQRGDINIRGGSGMLLQVIRSAAPAASL
jgi:hypothetical protein